MFTKKSIAVYFGLVFAAGLLAGAAAGFSLGMRRAFAPPPRPQDMAIHMCDQLSSRLRLTPEQLKQITPIVGESAEKIESVHATTGERIAKIIADSNNRLTQFLTPEQKILMEEMNREREQFFHKSFRPPPPGDRSFGSPPHGEGNRPEPHP